MPYEFDINTGQYIDTSVIDFSDNALDSKNGVLSVSDALHIAKTGLESIRVCIIGEVSQISNKPGYAAVYFSIKDNNAVLPCLMWKNRYMAMNEELKVGDLVELKGKFSLYLAKGRMNFDVSSFSLAGEGRLRQLVAQLEKKLRAMGLMDENKKKSLPSCCEKVGIITSPRGAVIHDIIRTIKRRNPLMSIFFAGCPVEGTRAVDDMTEAFDVLERQNLDVIILARGGGSFEDLMPFNDENLALRIAKCDIPVVSGIGHEPDTTIADLVSDFRASTPTAAAECISLNMYDYVSTSTNILVNFKNSLLNNLKQTSNIIDDISNKPLFKDPLLLFSKDYQTLDYFQNTLLRLGNEMVNRNNQIFDLLCQKLNDRSPLTVMSRGYSIATDDNGKILKSINAVCENSNIKVKMKDGDLYCRVKNVVAKDISEDFQ